MNYNSFNTLSFESRIRPCILSWSASSHLLQNWWTSAYQCIPESSQQNNSFHHRSKPGETCTRITSYYWL